MGNMIVSTIDIDEIPLRDLSKTTARVISSPVIPEPVTKAPVSTSTPRRRRRNHFMELQEALVDI